MPVPENIQAGVFFGFFCHSNDNQLKFNVKKIFRFASLSMARKMLFSVRLRHGAAAVPGQRNSNRERELERRNTMNAADTGFILICAAMVFVMTPAVALFYGGLVSARNVLSTSFHSYASLGLVTVIWAFVGYTLVLTSTASLAVSNMSSCRALRERRRLQPPTSPIPAS